MTPAGKNIFLSYSRSDQEHVQPLVNGLRRMRHEIWLDQELSGGQEWWDTILGRIRDCDAMLLAVSEKVLESQACMREFQYAKALNKPILPVMVDRVLPTLLWPDLFVLQLVDYTGQTDRAAFDLMAALGKLPPPGAPPSPLPEAPPVPISYLNDLGRIVQAPVLNLDEQLSVLGKLKAGLGRPAESGLVIQLLHKLRDRNDLYHAPAVEIDAVLAAIAPAEESELAPLVPHDDIVTPGVESGQMAAPTTVDVGTPSPDGAWKWNGAEWVAAQPLVQPEMLHTKITMSRMEIATIPLLATPIGLITIWFTRWSMRTKAIAAGVVGVIYLGAVVAFVVVNQPH